MPKRFCLDCQRLYDRDLTGTMRCPRCQPAATAARQARAPTASRGYGSHHQALRRQLLAAFIPGQPCARCGKPITSKNDAQLGHVDEDRSRHRGLEHTQCNEATAGRKSR
jgi:DNA-directed RNA polymerase subunit RPC12/RpoP